jgi:tRNA/tmRNA/rRNA uracil-C5-methylase (TrmA/RlmC/RlmD family)
MAGLYPAARVLGVDYHDASIAHSRAEAARRSVGNVRFEVAAAGRTWTPLAEPALLSLLAGALD